MLVDWDHLQHQKRLNKCFKVVSFKKTEIHIYLGTNPKLATSIRDNHALELAVKNNSVIIRTVNIKQ